MPPEQQSKISRMLNPQGLPPSSPPEQPSSQQQSKISAMLNPQSPLTSPSPGQSAPLAPAPASPAKWSVPAAPTTASGGQGITYTESAMERFAETSVERASECQQAHARAQQIQVSPDAFGFMFGRMVYSAYAQHAQSVINGLISAAGAMTEIAGGVRDSAKLIRDSDASTVQAATQITESAKG
jgi:hypothetical protein